MFLRKYLRDNEREDISKEALLLSVQILRNMNVQYVKSNDLNKNELLLIQIYQSYKRVSKCWQKDNPFSRLLLDVYQSIFGIKVRLFKICVKLKKYRYSKLLLNINIILNFKLCLFYNINFSNI